MKTSFTLTKKLTLAVLFFTAMIGFSLRASAQINCNAEFSVITDGNKIKVTALGNTTGAYLEWNFGDGGKGYQSPMEYTYQKDGAYTVCLVLKRYSKNPDTVCADTFCRTVEPRNPCTLVAAFNFQADEMKVYFGDATTGGTGLVYSWDFGDGKTSTDKNPTHQYLKPGTYKVCMTVATADKKCIKTICREVVVADPCDNLKAAFNFQAGGMKINFSDATTGGTGLTYKWDFGDGTTSTDKNPAHEYLKPGTYKVCLTVTSADKKCVRTICREVVVGDPCDGLKADFTYVIDAKGNVILDNTSIGNDLEYEWSYKGIVFSKTRHTSYYFQAPGTYEICLKIRIKNTNCVKTICKKIEIKPVPPPCHVKAWFTWLQKDNKIAFGNLSIGQALKYEWTVDGKKVSDAKNPTLLLKPGVYRVCLHIYTKDGRCKDSYCETVVVKPRKRFSRWLRKSEVEEETTPESTPATTAPAQKLEISAYPNPVSDILNIQVQGTQKATVVISNIIGSTYYNQQHTIEGNILNIPVSELPAGYYIVQVITETDGVSTLKIYKQ